MSGEVGDAARRQSAGPITPRPARGLVALDWGTSSLRAWHLPAAGPCDGRQRPWGILHLPDGGFPAALDAITQGWDTADHAIIACGMVGSRQGWREVPYVRIPAGAAAIAASLARLALPDGRVVHLVPGLLRDDATRPDVMRGEETQAIGAASRLVAAFGAAGKDALLVMPGTHGKWARLADGVITGFSTFMTGELYDVLMRHSILGRLGANDVVADRSAADEAFRRGVRASAGGALAALFSTRALALTGGLAPGRVADYLSGLLLGDEVRTGLQQAATASRGDTRPVIAIIGDGIVAARIGDAFAALSQPRPPVFEDMAIAGMLRIARAAGLIQAPAEGDDAC